VKVKVRAKRRLLENSIDICQGGVWETSFKRGKQLERKSEEWENRLKKVEIYR